MFDGFCLECGDTLCWNNDHDLHFEIDLFDETIYLGPYDHDRLVFYSLSLHDAYGGIRLPVNWMPI